MKSFHKRLWLGLFVMALASPLGILLPAWFKSGDAWGEWSAETLKSMLGYVPEGIRRSGELWKAPVADYSLSGEGSALGMQILSYIVSALLGVLVICSLFFLVLRILNRHEK